MMTVIGLMLATVGESALFNAPRFTMGVMDLQSGFSFITLAMALFALPEALMLVLDPKRGVAGGKDGKSGEIKDLRITGEEARKIAPVIGRQSIQGFLIGVMPGAGATIASFLGYAVERNIAKGAEQEEFGKGSVKGLAAPESANNARLHRLLRAVAHPGHSGFGHHRDPARRADRAQRQSRPAADGRQSLDLLGGDHFDVYRQCCPAHPQPAADPLYRAAAADPAQLPYPVHSLFHPDRAPNIGQNNATELLILVGLGVFATIMRFADYPLPPLLIGFILGGMLEDNFARAVNLNDGISFMWERPMTLGLLVIGALLILLPAYRRRRAKALQKGVAQGD